MKMTCNAAPVVVIEANFCEATSGEHAPIMVLHIHEAQTFGFQIKKENNLIHIFCQFVH